jgi:hypothetical protein
MGCGLIKTKVPTMIEKVGERVIIVSSSFSVMRTE